MITKINQATPITPKMESALNLSDAYLKRIVSLTLSSWWYMSSLHCPIAWIEPAIGACYDPILHECFNLKGIEHQKVPKEKSIRWILSRGFRFCTIEGDEATVVIMKARVII